MVVVVMVVVVAAKVFVCVCSSFSHNVCVCVCPRACSFAHNDHSPSLATPGMVTPRHHVARQMQEGSDPQR